MEEVGVQNILCMNGGDGETSYAKNSSMQRKIIEMARPFLREAVLDLYPAAASTPDKLTVADLGCSSGPNALAVVAGVVGTVEERCRQLGRPPPEFQLFLNDLPGNDFNSVFRSALPAFYEGREGEPTRCFVAGVPGSFYGRLFPTGSVHLFHSSSSLHWLSQAPPTLQQDGMFLNKGNAYFSKESPPFVVDAYARQFQMDFSDFLRSRSEEMVVGGRVVLNLVGRNNSDPASAEMFSYWGLLITRALMDMVREGHIAEERVDSFNVPCYAPCAMEVEREIRRDGSFSLKCLETLEADSYASSQADGDNHKKHGGNSSDAARTSTNCLRAILEPMITSHFGGDIIEDLFARIYKADEDYISTPWTTHDDVLARIASKRALIRSFINYPWVM